MPTMTLSIERFPRILEFRGQNLRVEELGRRLPFARKPASLSEMCASGEERIFITETIAMTAAEFDAFSADFTASQPWLAGKGGTVGGVCMCVEVCAPDRPFLYIDPAGGDYARYVARLG